MKLSRYLLLVLHFFLITGLQAQQLQSPAEFLGYELGERFTPHYRVIDYFEHVAAVTPTIKMEQYGETYEHRPLYTTFIASPENFGRLDEIRQNNMRRTGLEEGTPTGDKTAIVWLSFNVHGNEAVSTEASMQVLYTLADPNNTEAKKWLENTVVIIDPCINPDGRDRYVNWYNQKVNSPYNPTYISWEHQEPWPGGRANHYMFDLNRDWAWLTQQESRQRLKVYNNWLPQIHVDFHEQGMNDPYYFAPAAEPLHELISPWQREFETMIGKNNAKYFDKNSWLYFTKERFDLLYPSYGDTYPIYNGAIGMTFEQGGGGRGGLGVMTDEGDTLTLKDRIAHHTTTGLSTIEITAQNAEKVVDEFTTFYAENRSNPRGKYKAFVVKAGDQPDKIAALRKLLDQHKIRYGSGSSSKGLSGFSFKSGKTGDFRLEEGDLVISTAQPKSILTQVLFEPTTKLNDSITYDITAWALPYAYDLDSYALTQTLSVGDASAPETFSQEQKDESAYAYLVEWKSQHDVVFLAQLLKNGVKARFAELPFAVEGKSFEPGTLVIARADNKDIGSKFDETVVKLANELEEELIPVATGFVSEGKDFGSGSVRYINKPNIMLLAGDGTSSLSVGEIWHYFEEQIKYPISIVNISDVRRANLNDFNVIIVPNGYYGNLQEDLGKDKINSWISNGGKLILMENALSAFANADGLALTNFTDEEEKKSFERKAEDLKEKEQLLPYSERERRDIRDFIPGSIFRVQLDNTHPLAFGYPNYYFTLKKDNDRYAYLSDGWNVGVIKDKSDRLSGFAGSIALDKMSKSLVFGVEDKGRGSVVYLVDNPLFRSFWYNGKLLFGNAVFLVGNP